MDCQWDKHLISLLGLSCGEYALKETTSKTISHHACKNNNAVIMSDRQQVLYSTSLFPRLS